MKNTQNTQEVWTDYRMNDYVGAPIYATLTWPTRCQKRPSHTYGHLSGACLGCGAQPTIEYKK